MNVSRTPRRRGSAWAAVALVAVLGGSAGVLPPSAAASSPGRAQVDAAVLDAVSAGERSRFFVVLKDQADLSAAKKAKGHGARAKAAFEALRTEAADSQRPLRSFLDRKKVGYEPYWIANALLVTTDDKNVVEALAARADVARLVKERTYRLDAVEAATATASASASASASGNTVAADAPGAVTPEWGIADVKADQVWDQYGDRGEGVVIANIDSGVQYDHPALVGNYRGNLGNGAFAHDYNWYDPTGQCGASGTPCDNNGHGTHTMGTMVASGGVGVAPGATWIAAKGCESRSCSDASLLAAGQWILAPTDRNGQNPRPDLAPDIVNNSWGGGNTTFYQDIVEAWNSAGIFEAFAAGNDGDGVTCSTAHAPGAQAPAYGVGAYDSTGKIASFSGFGPSSVDGSAKPNISAPGVDIRSTWPGSTYNTINGTSMATPHVAGAVALLWSEAPSLVGNIDATRELLNDAAHDVDDTHCGGTADMNNVWGEGRLDVLGAVDAAPHTAAVVTGRVTDRATGTGIGTITVKAAGDAVTRSVTTTADGSYRLTLPAGTYSLTLSGYGYATAGESGYEVSAGGDTTKDFALGVVPHHAVTGTVLDVTGKPLPGATVKVAGTPVPSVTTDATGRFTVPDVAEGSFTLTAAPAAPVKCNGSYARPLTIDGDETATVRLPNRTDTAGTYSCAPVASSWIAGSTKIPLTGDEDAATVTLPFPVRFHDTTYTSASVTTNGLVNFLAPRLGDYKNTALPGAAQPDGVVAAFWDDLVLDRKSSVRTATTGSPGARRFAIVWNDAAFVAAPTVRISFEAVFDEASGAVTLQYKGIGSNPLQRGASATTGIENQAGTDGLGHSFDSAVLSDATAIRFTPKGA
ncbi:S8 family serine peptidase [Streptomyces roseolus]|uniref:S8 family serine peptidase n=1 Tax=Streptomyces roseolus TaxID=67358 RepID=UPI001674131A|nr:S8 family serine peptidase [Streptomyces roseolus]GGR41114.1 peptidase S8 [Streptomyces roseolus]